MTSVGLRIFMRTATWFGWVLRCKNDVIRLGGDYGGWWIPTSFVSEGRFAIGAGAGEDISFDIELARKGVKVAIVDPTPRAIRHFDAVSQQLNGGTAPTELVSPIGNQYRLESVQPENLSFYPVALWCRNEELRLFAPADPSHVSHSISNLQCTAESLIVQGRTLKWLLGKTGQKHIDILKMDIEGAEVEVLEEVLRTNEIMPDVLLVEFDCLRACSAIRAGFKLMHYVRKLRRAGYRVRCIENLNVTFERLFARQLQSAGTASEHY